VMAALRRLGAGAPGLLYADRHYDLNTPQSTTDGALDWMGLAHALALPGCVDTVTDAFGPRPLLEAYQVAWLGVEPRDQSFDAASVTISRLVARDGGPRPGHRGTHQQALSRPDVPRGGIADVSRIVQGDLSRLAFQCRRVLRLAVRQAGAGRVPRRSARLRRRRLASGTCVLQERSSGF
jgi:hypothetical protein